MQCLKLAVPITHPSLHLIGFDSDTLDSTPHLLLSKHPLLVASPLSYGVAASGSRLVVN
ncbi:hypothetical protein BDR06DRAFT_958801 [Suillus hirtellus]|nr:hypothetical protein BDR06DRAFT_958801 [Suillus hirtellus]